MLYFDQPVPAPANYELVCPTTVDVNHIDFSSDGGNTPLRVTRQKLNSNYTIPCLTTPVQELPNSAYTVSYPHANINHQVPNSAYTVSQHPNVHQLPNGAYTVSHANPALADESYNRSTEIHDSPCNHGAMKNIRDSTPYNDATPTLTSSQSDISNTRIQRQFQNSYLMRCNPVSIDAPTLSGIKEMVTSAWPVITHEARRAVPQFAQLYDAVKSHQVPNFVHWIPVSSGLNVQNWVTLLSQYHDNEICHFLQFGWPLGFYSDIIPTSVNKNHPSALAHPEHIQEFIKTEVTFGALVGPINCSPFTPWFRLSPLMTRPKKGSTQRRVIVDLSYPEGIAVNSGINIQDYLGRDISYTLPTVTDLISKLQVEGKGAVVWKADLARAYRQLRADPLDAPLLGIKHDHSIYIDRCPPFGCRSSSAACQRVANALVYILASNSHHCLAYLDDFAGCDSNINKATAGFNAFIALTNHLGLQLSEKKCMPPSTSVE